MYTAAVPLPPTPRPPRLSRIGRYTALYAGLTVVAVVWGALRGDADILRRGDSTVRSIAASILVGIAFGLLVAVLSSTLAEQFEWARVIHREFRALLCPIGSREIFLIAAASSIGEECFFRGALLPHIGLWPSTVLFALLHIGPGLRHLPWTAFSLIVGLALGAMSQHFGDLGGALAAHFTINLINLHHIANHEL